MHYNIWWHALPPFRSPKNPSRSTLSKVPFLAFSLDENLGLEGVLPGGEVDVLLVLLLGDEVGLVLGQPTSDSSGLLVSKVKGNVLGVLRLVQVPDVLPLLLVDDGQDTGDRLSDDRDPSQLVGASTGNLGDPQRGQLGLELIELGEQVSLVLALQLESPDLGRRRHFDFVLSFTLVPVR